MASMSAYLADISSRNINVIGDLRELTRIPAVREAIDDYVGYKANLGVLEMTSAGGVYVSEDQFSQKRAQIRAADDRCREITGWSATDLIAASGVSW